MPTSFNQTASVQNKRIGESVTLPYNGQTFTSNDGSVWLAQNGVPIAYSAATYPELASEAPSLISSGVVIPGPYPDGTWGPWVPRIIVGASTPGATWLAIRAATSVPGLNLYYTSTNAGATWTARTLPVLEKNWSALWDGTRFVLCAHGTGATGIQESTNGFTWTPQTGSVSSAAGDFIYNGSVYLIWPAASALTTCVTSTDRVTWTARTCKTTGAQRTASKQGLGGITWNAGAGLFIAGTSDVVTVGGAYQTSPTGTVWSAGTGLNGILTGSFILGVASSATTTIAMGTGPYVYRTTDGASWTAGTIDASVNAVTGLADLLFHDGTRFVVCYGGMFYYSTDAITWVRSTTAVLPTGSAAQPTRTPTGIAVSISTMVNYSNVASTVGTSILPVVGSTVTASMAYVRVK